MDSSSWSGDPDPSGASPWQSSPHISRDATRNSSEGGSEPSSPLAKHSTASHGGSADSELGGQDLMGSSAEALTSTQDQGSQQGLRQNGQQQHVPDGHERVAHQQQQQRDPPRQQQKPNQPSRYHGTAQQRQRQNLPQYRLSAKVTGLERTGRKDPVLKFDVHVCSPRFFFVYGP